MSATVPDLDDLLTSPLLAQNPYPVYARLQEHSPVHWCKPWRQWLVTRHADVEEILKSPDRFSSCGWEQRFMSLLPQSLRDELSDLSRHYSTPVLSNTDPPAHRRLRTMVIKSFTPRVLRNMAPAIEALVTERLPSPKPQQGIELISQFAYPLPAFVIAQLLGAPVEAQERYAAWSADIVAFVGTGTPHADRARRVDRSLREFREHLEPLLAVRRAEPTGDLLSHLASEHDGERLSDQELVATCVTLLFAGHETTANLIGNGMLALLDHPDQLQLLREQPDRMPTAIEEMLRYDGPVQRVRRVAITDTTIAGQEIRKGELVMGFIGAANRDPDVFDDPHRFDVTRDPSHLAFGKGIHFCVGGGLSRIEAPIALNAILNRFPSLRLADRPVWKPNITFRGLERLNLSVRRLGAASSS